jgi:ArsR family transcriptional regulator, arsenate/arsenite/antimonite-responsive transcriptional repressor
MKLSHFLDNSRNMEVTDAVKALAALAQDTRLQVLRLLVQAGPNGLRAGAIAQAVGVPPSTLSFHLKELDRAGLARSWRVQRQIRYAADYEGLRRLLSFLTADCCNGHPQICGGLMQAVAACGCDD